MFRLASVAAVVALLVPFHAIAQTSPPAPTQSAPAANPPAPLPPQGVISVYVTGVVVKTRS
jgi:hypothetical protein